MATRFITPETAAKEAIKEAIEAHMAKVQEMLDNIEKDDYSDFEYDYDEDLSCFEEEFYETQDIIRGNMVTLKDCERRDRAV